jgi:hypothetical protein
MPIAPGDLKSEVQHLPESDGLFFWSPPFAPELCWWARTMVESIITYSLSGSCDRVLKTRSQPPLLLHREWRRCTTRKSPNRSGKSRQGMPERYRYSTASTNNRLSRAVTPTWPSRPGSKSLMRSHWSSLSGYLRPIGFHPSLLSNLNAGMATNDDRP